MTMTMNASNTRAGNIHTFLTFDPEKHEYHANGELVPSVTQVLGQWLLPNSGAYYIDTVTGQTIDAESFGQAREAGNAIHKGAAYLLKGEGLNWNALATELAAPLRQCEEWIKTFGVKPLYVEEPMYSKTLGVAGTPDVLCAIYGDPHGLALVDIKTGLVNDMVGPQTAAYEKLARDFKGIRKIIRRYSLVLPRNGSPYKFTPLTDEKDYAFFCARLTQFNYLKGRQ